MTWPQIVVALLTAWSLLSQCVGHVRNRELSSGAATALVGLVLAMNLAYAWVLHEGGFW